jgi:hypothetical protein
VPRVRPAALLTLAALACAAPAAFAARPPAAPSHVRATASGTTVTVRWKRPAHHGLRIRLTVAGHTLRPKAAATSARIAHLKAGRTYTILVRTCGPHRCSAARRVRVHVASSSSAAGPGSNGNPTTTTTGGPNQPAGTTTPGTAIPAAPGTAPQIAGCPIFPDDNPWNEDISQLPVDPRSDTWLSGIAGNLHPDFGSGQYGDYGIPFTVVPAGQPLVPMTFSDDGEEDDPGPYPIPADARIEGGAASDGDRHVLVLQQGSCMLYELDNAVPADSGGGWSADFGAKFDLRSNALRPDGWTSADAAGLPILAGLARADEANAGAIHHALRFTVQHTQRGYVYPARHFASKSSDASLPPMGMRVRLKASFDTSGYHGQALAILNALKTYGMILADNGSNWYISGTPDPAWNDDDLDQLKRVPGTAFEVVNAGTVTTG